MIFLQEPKIYPVLHKDGTCDFYDDLHETMRWGEQDVPAYVYDCMVDSERNRMDRWRTEHGKVRP